MSTQIPLKNFNQTFRQPSNFLKVAIETHGCKLNRGDTENLVRQFIDAGYEIKSQNELFK